MFISPNHFVILVVINIIQFWEGAFKININYTKICSRKAASSFSVGSEADKISATNEPYYIRITHYLKIHFTTKRLFDS